MSFYAWEGPTLPQILAAYWAAQDADKADAEVES